MPLKISTRECHPMCFELALDGRLDMETHAQLQAAVDMIFASAVKAVRLDLDKLEYINSMGLRVLFMASKKAKAQNATFVIVRPQPQVKAILDIAKALPSQAIFRSLEEADRYFDTIQKKTLSEIEDASPAGDAVVGSR